MNSDGQMLISERTKIRTIPKRGSYDFETIVNILDDTFLCHIGFTINEQPYVIPTCFGRNEDRVFFHGAKGGRMLKHIKTGSEICIAITHVDGIVLARSAFHHSINYRSAIIFGKAVEITETNEKTEALKTITEHIINGRWNDVREPVEKELNATSVFYLPITEASAKIRTGGPIDEPEDMNLNVWAGVLPFRLIKDNPIPDRQRINDVILPDYLLNFKI